MSIIICAFAECYSTPFRIYYTLKFYQPIKIKYTYFTI